MASAPVCNIPLAIPFSEFNKTVPLPDKRQFPEVLKTIGNHLKQARLTRKILIKDIIVHLQIDRETLRGWELGDFEPHVSHYPRIISFLGYNPLQIPTETLSGKIKQYRYVNGLTQDKFAQLFGTDRSTVWEWESNNREPIAKTKKRILDLVKER